MNSATLRTFFALALLASASLPAGAQAFRNTSNAPFASRCNGPQGAVVVEDGEVATAAVRTRALQTQHGSDRLAHAQSTVRRLQRLGVTNPRSRARLPRLVVHRRYGQMVLPDLANTAQTGQIGNPANQLTFEFTGWSDSERAILEAYLSGAYPKARLIYGAPAFNIKVNIIKDNTITQIQGGVYDATANEIRMPELSGNIPEDTYILMLLVLRAFHDDAFLFYDAWEEGFVGAAATAVQVQPGVSPDFNPSDPGPFYSLSVYEAENHPGLAAPTFYSGGDFGGMLVWRIAMCRAAWMKCWIEDNDFFARFNQSYYQQFTQALPGDVPALREIAVGALPTVEGTPFQEWFVRQYVLDTSIRSGLKEYTWNIPLDNAVVLIVEHFLTDSDGSEFPRGGQARTTYWSYDFVVNLYAEEGNLVEIPVTGETPGEGFLLPTFFNIGGPQRITVQMDLSGLRSYYPFPYGVRGLNPGENNLYGGVLNETKGTVNVTGGSGLTDLSANRGVWGGVIASPALTPLKLTVALRNNAGQETVRQVNVGWDSYMILQDGGAQATLTHVFAFGDTGLHLMSLPLLALGSSAPQVLGIPPADLLLARWRPELPPDGRYEIWPACEFPAPGKAFWLRTFSDLPLALTGVKPSERDRILVPLDLGWNMIGSVRATPVPVAELKVQVGSDAPMPLAEAVAKRYVQTGVFGYSQDAGYEPAETLRPFGGYWIRALVAGGCRLAFEPVQTETTALRAKTAAISGGGISWRLPLVAQSGRVRASAYLGGAPGASAKCEPALDLGCPPAFGPGLSLRFRTDEAGAGEGLYADVRSASPVGETWELDVAQTAPNQAVTLAWPDLSQVPADLRPVLTDPQTGTRVYMRTTPGYTIPGSTDGVERRLEIELCVADAGALVITSASVRPSEGGTSLCITTSREAAVSARVLNLAGRPIRVLSQGKQAPAGETVIPWNLRDQRGTKVPSGMYLLEAEVRAEDGQSTRIVRTTRVVPR